jgi:hypothetical protein
MKKYILYRKTRIIKSYQTKCNFRRAKVIKLARALQK